MSLLSLLNTNNSSSGTASSAVTSAIQKLSALKSAKTETANAAKNPKVTSDVAITQTAKITAAEKADSKKDFAALGNEMRSTLNAQYVAAKAGGNSAPKPNLTNLSGRALAAIILNKTGTFNRAEIHAARSEMKQRDRSAVLDATASGMNISTLTTYSKQMLASYDSMSVEEREVRGSTSNARATAASFIKASTNPSLFDKLG
jgi:hypothetical protein